MGVLQSYRVFNMKFSLYMHRRCYLQICSRGITQRVRLRLKHCISAPKHLYNTDYRNVLLVPAELFQQRKIYIAWNGFLCSYEQLQQPETAVEHIDHGLVIVSKEFKKLHPLKALLFFFSQYQKCNRSSLNKEQKSFGETDFLRLIWNRGPSRAKAAVLSLTHWPEQLSDVWWWREWENIPGYIFPQKSIGLTLRGDISAHVCVCAGS